MFRLSYSLNLFQVLGVLLQPKIGSPASAQKRAVPGPGPQTLLTEIFAPGLYRIPGSVQVRTENRHGLSLIHQVGSATSFALLVCVTVMVTEALLALMGEQAPFVE